MLAAALCLPRATEAGDWHRTSSLKCSDCHTMHNSQFGQPMRYDSSLAAADQLLRAENTTALCLACHSGGAASQGQNVRAPSNYDPPGGGFPADLSDPDHTAHSIGTEPVIPPDGDTPVVMTCVTCHEPHGNGAYRNLRPNPSGNPARIGVAPVVQQTTLPNGSNAALVYTRANVRYVSGMSQWCLTCHNLIAEDASLSHPWDRAIWGSATADYQIWSGPIEDRVPVQNALGQPSPDQADQVFCLSCHKAHGSPNLGAIIKPDPADETSPCSQCHDR
jgi:predicted CXXCH cytochrome family protein